MFSDPMSITRETVVKSLPRIAIQGQSSTYRQADGANTVKVSHQSTSKQRVRRMIRLDAVVPGTNALTGAATNGTCAVYLVIDQPSEAAFTPGQYAYKNAVEDLLTFLTANTAANLFKVLGSEI